MGWVTIVPASEDERIELIRTLRGLADGRGHIRSQRPKKDLLVPEYLADKYHEVNKPKPRRKRAPKKEEGEEQ